MSHEWDMFDEWLIPTTGYYFDVACRPLIKELSQAKKEAIMNFYEANKHKLYEQNWIEVSNAV
jgi:hypothetical protein